jgi:hypothetical protein
VTIRKGEPWGAAVASPDGLPVMADDAALAAHVTAARRRGRRPSAVGVAGGDLARTMGGGSAGRFPGTVTKAPVDVMCVQVPGTDQVTWAVAHVVARRGWRGEVVFAMNAEFLGRFDVAPRSHPNDGKVDVLAVAAAMPLRARWQARRRARSGTHLPHPQLTVTHTATFERQFARPLQLWIDGQKWVRAGAVRVEVEPDAFDVFA